VRGRQPPGPPFGRAGGVDKVVSPAGLPVQAAAPEKPADLTVATDNLAKLLGKKKRSFNKPWYDGLES
jgi:hypothetical protein